MSGVKSNSKGALALRLRILTFAFLGVLIAIIGGTWFLSEATLGLKRQQQWVEYTHKVIAEIETTMASLVIAESAQRGYFHNPLDSFLADRNQAVRQTWEHFTKLRALVVSPDIRAEVDHLEEILKVRVSNLDRAMTDFRSRGAAAARDSVMIGQQTMHAARRQANVIEAKAQELLAARDREVERRSYILMAVIIATMILNLVISGLAFWFLRRNLIAADEEARRRAREARIASGAAEMARTVGGDQSLHEIATKAVAYITNALNVPAARLFLEMSGGLRLLAGPGTENKVYGPSEGLVGRAFLADGIVYQEEIPPDYFRIDSGLGSSVPRHLVFLPVMIRDRRIGVLELATFDLLTDENETWAMRVAETLAGALEVARGKELLQELLAQTQQQAEELQQQQEELRTTNEELEQQTRAIMESQDRLQVQTEELRQMNEELEQQTRNLETQQDTLNLRNQALETSRKRLEEKATELERANRYKSEFLAKMSHELRTPLNSLMILATLLEENKHGNLNSQQIEFAHTIHDAGQDLLELINDILDLSKLEARKLHAKTEMLELRPFVDQLMAAFRAQAGAKGLALEISIAETAPERLCTDRQRLQQVLRNLIGNALKFTEAGAVSLRIFKSPLSAEKICFAVTDTGIGIPDAKKQLIWEAFEQVDSSVSRKFGGTGLGLTISRELAHLLGGQISVESEAGRGSQFTLEIPVNLEGAQAQTEITQPIVAAEPAPLKAEPESPKPEPRASRAERSILVIEPDEHFATSVSELVKAHGFMTIEARNVEAALEILRKQIPMAVLLDASVIPEGAKRDVTGEIRQVPGMRHVPIHMISSKEDDQGPLARGGSVRPVSLEGIREELERLEGIAARKMKRLLVVEDDSRQRTAIVELVTSKDTEILAVDSGQEALEILRKGAADCVVLDLSLPDMTGFEVLEALGSLGSSMIPPVIVYTGRDLSKEEEDRLRRFSDSIIIKGSKSPARLLDEVNLFLHRVERDTPEETRVRHALNEEREIQLGPRNLLLADDDLRNLFALTSALEGKGFKVIVARDGQEALEKLDQNPLIDAVLMDIMMPRLDGLEAMRRIRANSAYRDLPIIALTAKAMKGEHERCVEAGASDYLPKPVNLSQLLSVLRVWLAEKGQMA